EILVEFVLLSRRTDCDAQPCITHASQQVWDRREGTDEREILTLEPLSTPILHFFAVIPLFVDRQKHGNELVAALADLTSRLLEAHIVAKLHKRFVPSERMQIDGVQERPVKVEDGGFGHLVSSGARPPDLLLAISISIPFVRPRFEPAPPLLGHMTFSP